MSEDNKDSRLIPILREGIAIIQMVFFKNLKEGIAKKYSDLEPTEQIMLTGAITNEIFDSHNRDAKFLQFRQKHRGTIEQELLAIPEELSELIGPLADALRVQVLCDEQEGVDSSHILIQADKLKLLPADREMPLPSTFMESVRTLGPSINSSFHPLK